MNRGQPFLSDIQELRRRAREHITQGAVTLGEDDLANLLEDLGHR